MDVSGQALVDSIVKEVIGRLRETECPEVSEGKATSDSAVQGPSVLVLFTGSNRSLDVVSRHLEEMAALPCRYHCAYSRSAAAMLGMKFGDILKPVTRVVEGQAGTDETAALEERCDLVAVPVLSENTLAKAALGIQDSLASRVLGSAFMAGKPVVIARDCVPVDDVLPAYRQMIIRYIKALESLGARVTCASDFVAQIGKILGLDGVALSTPRVAEESFRSRSKEVSRLAGDGQVAGRLVDLCAAEAWVKQRGVANPLVIKPGTMITPLAMDYLREKRVAIISNS